MVHGIFELLYMIFTSLISFLFGFRVETTDGQEILSGFDNKYSLTQLEIDEPREPAIIEAYLEGDIRDYVIWNAYAPYSGDVVGRAGVPIRVEGDSSDSVIGNLSLVFIYDEEKLRGKEEDLGVLWYNEPDDWYETVTEYEIDYEQNMVTIPVSAPGVYILEDMKAWESVWDGTYNHGTYTSNEPVCHWYSQFVYRDIEDLADVSMYNGDTTEYHITTVEQLAGLVKLVNEGNSFLGCDFYLDADLDLEGYEWAPIGWKYPANGYAGKDFPFEGRFYGNGHTIYNMNIVAPYQSDLGMFGRTLQGFEVHDLALIDCYIEGKYYVGGIVGDNINSGDEFDMTNCVVSGTVKGESTVGALVGSSAYLRIKDCYALMENGSITNLTGDLRSGYVQNSYINDDKAEEALSEYK